MKPGRHCIASFFAGITLWALTSNKLAGVICFLSGVLPDVDHVAEYVIHKGFNDLNPRRMYKAFDREKGAEISLPFPKIYLFLHSGELAVLLWLAALYSNAAYVIAAAVGYSLHLIMDIRGNKDFPVFFYWIAWRMLNRFNSSMLSRSQKTVAVGQNGSASNPGNKGKGAI